MADTTPLNNLVIVSGIPAGNSGTGRLVAHLQERIKLLIGARPQLLFRPERPARWQLKIWLKQKEYRKLLVEGLLYIWLLIFFWMRVALLFVLRGRNLILLHPQNLGYRLTLGLIESRKNEALIYLLDSSFFCVASYNHIQGEDGACVRCIEAGFCAQEIRGCKPFPKLDWSAIGFSEKLKELVKNGRVRIVAQNERQAQLAQMHFEMERAPEVIGLWTNDWDELFEERPWELEMAEAYKWDVVFHGHCLDAKGSGWTFAVADKCPELNFFFPFEKPNTAAVGVNCTFESCTWETGLKEKMKSARFVIVPSLWSAPIEGALVKSLLCADAVAVVQNPTSFSDELTEEMVLKLPADPESASKVLSEAVLKKWKPDRHVMLNWINAFSKNKSEFFTRLIKAMGPSV